MASIAKFLEPSMIATVPPDPILQCTDLHKSYGSLQVLKGVSTTVQAGDVVSIIGPSGCGKSTFLRCLNRLEGFEQGQLRVLGRDIPGGPLGWRHLRALRIQVGMVFQQFNLFPHLTVLENLVLPPRQVLGLPLDQCRDRAMHHLEHVGLAQRGDAVPYLLQPPRVAPDHHHVGARLGERQRHGPPQTGVAAGDQRGATVEPEQRGQGAHRPSSRRPRARATAARTWAGAVPPRWSRLASEPSSVSTL